MRKFKLTDNEIFSMVNDPPTSLLHIQLLVEDSEERLTEDQVTEVLQIVERLLLPPPEAEAQDTSGENEEEENTQPEGEEA